MSKHAASIANKLIKKELQMPAGLQPMRIDTFLAAPEFFNLSRTHAQKLIDNGDVFVNGKSVLKKSLHVKPMDTVAVELIDATPSPSPPDPNSTPQQAPFKGKKLVATKKVKEGNDGEDEIIDATDTVGVDDADELENGPKNTTEGPLIMPIDIFSSSSLFLLD